VEKAGLEGFGPRKQEKEVEMNNRKMNNTATLEKEDVNNRMTQEAAYYSGLQFKFTEYPSDMLKAWIEAEVSAGDGRD
jgi:hypothetical protein